MSYRLEKEQSGNEAIVIDGWEEGSAKDPYSGLGKMLDADLSTPGEISVGYPLSFNTTSGGTLGIPIHDTTKEAGGVATNYFILDAGSQVWTSTTYSGNFSFLSSSNTTTGGTATNQGLCYFIPRSGGNGYLFKFRDSHIDYLAGGSGSWVSNWNPADGTTTSSAVIVPGVNHYAIEGQDSVMYFCNGAGIGSLFEVDGQVFDPTNPATYSFAALDASNPTTTANAVPIVSYDRAQSIAEQGSNLLIGGSLNAIYPWDRISPQPGFPLYIGDTFIDRMVTVNTNVYIFAGGSTSRGRIFVTNGSQVNLFFKIPDYITGYQDPYFTWGDAIFHRNNLIFSFFMIKNGGGFVPLDVIGGVTSQVWAIDLDTNAFRALSKMDAPSVIGRANVLMPALQSSPGFGYILAYEDSQGGSTSAIQNSGTASGTGRFNAYTDLIPIGTFLEKRTFSQVEFKLRTGLESGENIAIVPIVDGVFGSDLAFTLNATVGTISDVAPVNFEKAQWLQFFVQGNGASQTSGVRLHEIRLR